ncbi:MAG: primosomal protein N' [Bacteroidales bacterium]|nr:primosomal protein N' [Bacteroidales bacterium]MCI7654609.1 primosomal protein N' [Bacteroidales bacterium]MDD7706301.1 primosomal protein N' [Bacteroidales bacterium]MDY4706163.1 primosomal protein N' [Prevotella sp.]MDY4952045.1 primosomal protein N' [Prevotella sp.]
MQYADVILPLAVDGVFTYLVPTEFQPKAVEGSRVLVPLGRSKLYVGIVLRLHDTKPQFKCREIERLLDDAPMLLPYQLRIWQWISDYYMSSLGDVMVAALPAGLKQTDKYKPRTEQYVTLAPSFRTEQRLRVLYGQLHRSTAQDHLLSVFLSLSHWDSLQGASPIEPIQEITREELLNESHSTTAVLNLLVKRGALATYEKEVGRLNVDSVTTDPPHPLNSIQQQAYDDIRGQFKEKNVVLLHGVTSSGKTEIYIHLIEEAISGGKQVLYLLPEIALTVQMMTRLKRVFGNRLGIYHSKYSDAERVEIWQKQLSDQPYDVILGARSAVFLPFKRLGLVIVDEEHESSYKQQDPAPRYHARSVAIVMAQAVGAKTLLGTATPSIETYHNALTGKFGLVTITRRFKGVELPQIEIVDIKDLRHRKMMRGPLSPQLTAAVREAVAAGQQAILFQNRRGFAQMLECPTCGWTPRCSNCDVTLTYHKTTGQLVCHYCGFTCNVPSQCPACGERHLFSRGFGTEKIEDIIREELPEARVARMDLDSTRSKNAYERIINDFSAGRTNVLVGTQMITKGLDFGRVSVVGILDADTMLNYPDFRAYEQAFTMMAQVSGRAGRRGSQGRVLLQTRSPELPVIRQVVGHDYRGFYNDVIQERKDFHYPPFYHLVYVYLKHKNSDVVELAANELGNRLRQGFGQRVLGPDKPAVARVKTLAIRKIVIKLENGVNLPRCRQYLREVHHLLMQDKRYASLQVYYDVDPQ